MEHHNRHNTFHGNSFAVAFIFFLIIHLSLFTSLSCAVITDGVAAFVDDQAITQSELMDQYESARKLTPDITLEQVVNTMINRVLIVREAGRSRIEAPSEDEIMRDFIDLKVRAFIKLGETEIEEFYKKNKDRFAGKDYEEVRNEIEKYLTESELNEKLKETLKELRKKAYIKIMPYVVSGSTQ